MSATAACIRLPFHAGGRQLKWILVHPISKCRSMPAPRDCCNLFQVNEQKNNHNIVRMICRPCGNKTMSVGINLREQLNRSWDLSLTPTFVIKSKLLKLNQAIR